MKSNSKKKDDDLFNTKIINEQPIGHTLTKTRTFLWQPIKKQIVAGSIMLTSALTTLSSKERITTNSQRIKTED